MQFTPTQLRAAAWTAITGMAVLSLWLLGPVLTPFLVAAVLAYALTPVVDRLDALWGGRLPRLMAVVLVELGFVLTVFALLLLVVPVLAKEIPLMREQVPVLLERLQTTLRPLLDQWGIRASLDFAVLKQQLLGYLAENWDDGIASIWPSLKLGGSVALAVIGNLVLIPVALFYLLLDWKPLVARLMEFVPPRLRPGVNSFTGEADQVLGQYLRGQLLVMATMAVFYSTGLALFGLDLALPIGVFTGLAMFVPYVGFGIGLLLATLAGVLEFASIKALVMVGVVYGTGQIVEGFYLTPRFVG